MRHRGAGWRSGVEENLKADERSEVREKGGLGAALMAKKQGGKQGTFGENTS